MVKASGGTISGGLLNTCDGYGPVIGGGMSNEGSANFSTIGGGYDNQVPAVAFFATVGGGDTNVASGIGCTVGGGKNNNAGGYCQNFELNWDVVKMLCFKKSIYLNFLQPKRHLFVENKAQL